jgi:hypothetical protein
MLAAPGIASVTIIATTPLAPVRVDRVLHAGRAPPHALPALAA